MLLLAQDIGLHAYRGIRVVKTNLRFKGKLFLAVDIYNAHAGGFPRKTGERLYYLLGDKVRMIRRLDQLTGEVSISNERDALEYVRLRTAIPMFHAFERPTAEVRTFEELKSEGFYGLSVDPDLHTARKFPMAGHFGLLPKETFDALGFPVPRVTRREKGFAVERVLVTGAPRGDYIVQLVSEMVGTRGDYRSATKSRFTSVRVNTIKWFVGVDH